jgi:hypothetical protein
MQNIRITPPSSRQPLDTQWYQKLLEATKNIRESFILLEPSKPYLVNARQEFMDFGRATNPVLRPRHLNKRFLELTVENLQKLQEDISEQEPNEHVRVAYRDHIAERITNVEMVRASVEEDWEKFREYNVHLYGLPDTDIFRAACTWIRKDAQQTSSAVDSHLTRLRDDVLRLTPDVVGKESLLMPDKEVFQSVRDSHFAPGGYFEQLFAPDGPPEEPYIEQRYGDSITARAIANVGSDYTIKSAADGLWAVLSSSRDVVRPLGYRVDRDYFVGVIAHEIGSHLLEESNGSLQPLKLLRLGLAGFEKGNEGRAYLREQIVYPTPSIFTRQTSWEYILMLHLSVSLAFGLDGRPYTFVELYEYLYALHHFWRERRYPLATNNDAEAKEEAWLLAVRIMKGTDGTGGCYMKDTVYLEGNVAVWKLAAVKQDMIPLGDTGKFNIIDKSHLALLRYLNILPAET